MDTEELNKGPSLTIHALVVFSAEKVIYANDRHLHSVPVLLSNFHIQNHLWVSEFVTCKHGRYVCVSVTKKTEKINSTESDFTFSPFTLSILYSFAFPCWGFVGLSTKFKYEMKIFLQFQSKAIRLKGEKVVLLIVHKQWFPTFTWRRRRVCAGVGGQDCGALNTSG